MTLGDFHDQICDDQIVESELDGRTSWIVNNVSVLFALVAIEYRGLKVTFELMNVGKLIP